MSTGLINDGIVDTEEPMSQINITPFIDIMLCLLIMFMVATPLMTPKGIDVTLPVARGEKIDEEAFLRSVISVDAKGNVFLGMLPLANDPEKMRHELAQNAKLNADGMAFIQADENVAFDRIVDVLVAVKDAGVSNVGFITDPAPKKKRP